MRRFLLFRLGVVIAACVTLLNLSCKKDSSPTGPGAEVPSTIGQLTVNPTGIVVNTPAIVTFKLTVPAGITLVDSTVKLVRLNAAGEQVSNLTRMYNDGLLLHGDDILGDNIFSAIDTLTESATGQLRVRAVASIKTPTPNAVVNSDATALTVYTDITSGEIDAVTTTYDSTEVKLNQYLAGNPSNISTAMAQLAVWLQNKPEVASIEQGTGTSILIRFASGLNGGIIVSLEDNNGEIDTRGGVAGDQQRRNTKAIPLSRQTVGTTRELPGGLTKVSRFDDLDPKVIGNRNALIFAPFEAAFTIDEGPSVQTILQTSGYEFAITYVSNQAATIASLGHLTDYGFVLLATHGSGGKEFGTGEIVDTNLDAYKTKYKAMLRGGTDAKLAVWNNVVISKTGTVKTTANIYAIRAPFIRDLAGNFPNSVILNNSCESAMNPDLSDAFIGKGAKTYYGYTKVVNSNFCLKNADTIAKRLATDLKTTGEAFMAGSDPQTPNAVFQINGSHDVHYVDTLINGDFEFGKIDGWTKSGDGRVISQLSSVKPPGGSYMGIISTGLGFTTTSGSIFQTFRVTQGQTTLTVKWNFLSEEFLEFIASKYQDYFQIVIKNEAGTENVLLDRTIDGLAAQFGATKLDPGSLISVSPDIVFDRGGVYMTGWQTSTFSISAYVGQKITIILRAGDVGDSIYDTAIVLDDITVK